MKCLILEDDIMARRSLERLCTKHPDLDLVASCENVDDALKAMRETHVDLIFLDIEMPGANGFDLLEKSGVMPYVIVTSSEEKYAYQAFQYEVSDYLKKPVSLKKLKQSVEKVLQLDKGIEPTPQKDSIFIKADGKFIQLKLDDILFIENVGDYARFHTEKKKFIVHGTMKNLASKLPDSKFMKVHRSYIVNLDKIVDIEENTILIHGKVIPVSRANKQALMERLNIL